MRKEFLFKIIVLFLLLSGCGNQQPAPGNTENDKNEKSHLPTITIDQVVLNVEIAQDPETRQKGLMNRDFLPENQGMLFVFEESQYLPFWMRNTFIPLDIAFIAADGTIVDIQHMAPLDETKQYISSAPALYALEVNEGWFARHGIKVGNVVHF